MVGRAIEKAGGAIDKGTITMPRVVLLLLALLVHATSGSTQYHTAGWSLIGDANAATLHPVAVGHIDSAGALTTLLPFSKLAQYDHAHGGALDADDRTYIVAILSKTNTGKLFRVDRSGTLLQTLQVLTSPPPGGGYVYDTAFVTLKASAPFGIQSISNTYSFKIQ